MGEVLLSASGLQKSYAAPVLRGVDFELRSGEVHALVGANGAGKTTLCRITCGLTPHDGGRMFLGRDSYRPDTVADGQAAGVRMVMQELNLIDTLSVAENLFLDRLPLSGGLIDYGTLHRDAGKLLSDLGLENIEPQRAVGELGVGQKQLVEIGRVIFRPCRALILDEPTAALTDPEIELLFARIERLRAAGTGIIYVSHRMREIRQIADRITVLRDGINAGTWPTDEVSDEQIVTCMAGREFSEHVRRDNVSRGAVALAISDLSTDSLLRNINLDLNRGEILGIAGLIGSGRTELLRAIFGADGISAGKVRDGETGIPLNTGSPAEAVRSGIALVPEDRKQQGLLLEQSVRCNISLAALKRYSNRAGFLDLQQEALAVSEQVANLDIQCNHPTQPASELSGGNQQKLVIARWLLRDSRVLLFDEPTRGIDIHSKYAIYDLLSELAAQQKAVVVVSSENHELMAICDRIAVLSNGGIAAVFERGEWSADKLMAASFSAYTEVA